MLQFQVYLLSKFQVYVIILLTVITMLYVTWPNIFNLCNWNFQPFDQHYQLDFFSLFLHILPSEFYFVYFVWSVKIPFTLLSSWLCLTLALDTVWLISLEHACLSYTFSRVWEMIMLFTYLWKWLYGMEIGESFLELHSHVSLTLALVWNISSDRFYYI